MKREKKFYEIRTELIFRDDFGCAENRGETRKPLYRWAVSEKSALALAKKHYKDIGQPLHYDEYGSSLEFERLVATEKEYKKGIAA